MTGKFIKSLTLTLVTGVFLLGFVPVAWAFARGYITNDAELKPGMAASLNASGTAEKPVVERSSPENAGKVIGIATNPEQNLAVVASGDEQVYIQTSGSVDAFVSDLNGQVKKGDRVAVSALRGILMRADGSQNSIGVALEDFKPDSSETQTVTGGDRNQVVKIAKVPITFTSSAGAATGSTGQGQGQSKSSLERFGTSVTGKDVTTLQMVIALVIFLIVIIAEGAIIYGAVSSGITSMGRNPLSRDIIRSELARVLGLAVVVLLVGLASIYAIMSI